MYEKIESELKTSEKDVGEILRVSRGRSIIGRKESRLPCSGEHLFSLLVRPPWYPCADLAISNPSGYRAHAIISKSFPRPWSGGSDKEKERAVVLGKSGRMVIFPLPDVQNHASPRPPSPL